MEDRLVELLRRADRAMPPPTGESPDLVKRVHALRERRRVVRVTTGALAAVLMIALGAGLYVHYLHRGRAPSGEPARDLFVRANDLPSEEFRRAEQRLDRLAADVDATLALVKSVRDRQTASRLAMTLDAALDPADRADQELNRAAFTMVYQADRMYRELDLKESAIRDYRQAIKMFPQTQWAQVARERLAQIETKHGDRL